MSTVDHTVAGRASSPLPSAGASGDPARRAGRLGTFGGVFTPSILTIFGVIMFLRAGYVVGQGGVGGALAILLIGEAIVLATTLSMSAIATNTPVRGGGAYFLISRALGPQYGSAIGATLFLGQAVSVPFYVLGFAQALVRAYPAATPYLGAIVVTTTVGLFALNYVGTEWAIKAQYVVLGILGLAIVVFLGGAGRHFRLEALMANWGAGYTGPEVSFWVLFATYFPAVTGILAGINMSGDLRDPARSLVRGTLAAVVVGGVVYLGQIVLCGGAQARVDLIERPFETLLAQSLFGLGFLVVGGVFAATLSSALGSFLGAPRVLQALARDRVLPGLGWFARGTRRHDEPRAALWLTGAVAVVVGYAASRSSSLRAFDLVASLITMFFLATYGMINLAAFVESFGANPSFRPSFRHFHWLVSLGGAVGCGTAMFLIDMVAALVALAVIAGVYALASRQVYQQTFGDARRGFVYAVIRRGLQGLSRMASHPKNWRPTILVLSGNPAMRGALVRYGAWLGGGRGLVTVAEILIGRLEDLLEARDRAQAHIDKVLADERLTGFAEVLVAEELDEGIRALVQAHSLAPIKPNTVLFGWPGGQARVAPFMGHLRVVSRLRKNLVCVIGQPGVDGNGSASPAQVDRIDVWWDSAANNSLMLVLAHLLTENWTWRQTTIRVLRAVPEASLAESARRAAADLLGAGRIEGTVEVVVGADGDAARAAASRDSRLVMLGFRPPDEPDGEAIFSRIAALMAKLPSLMLVTSTGEADLCA